MKSPMFLFGLKLGVAPNHVDFFDADFCNALIIQSGILEGMSLEYCCDVINQLLTANGFQRNLLEVGKLNLKTREFSLKEMIVKKEYKIHIRFANF